MTNFELGTIFALAAVCEGWTISDVATTSEGCVIPEVGMISGFEMISEVGLISDVGSVVVVLGAAAAFLEEPELLDLRGCERNDVREAASPCLPKYRPSEWCPLETLP